MSTHDTRPQHFLVEWYQPALSAAPPKQTAARLEGGAATVRTRGATVRLLLTLTAPADDVLYCVLSADCVETVLAACREAGCPPDRVTTGVHPHLST